MRISEFILIRSLKAAKTMNNSVFFTSIYEACGSVGFGCGEQFSLVMNNSVFLDN
jgi:hypothetical protein